MVILLFGKKVVPLHTKSRNNKQLWKQNFTKLVVTKHILTLVGVGVLV
jgi:hypothetical protein